VSLTVEELDPASDSAVAEFYQQVLVPHFRDAELVSPESFSSGLRSGETMALLARTAEGVIAGGAVGDLFPRSRVLLLSYLAVPAEGRGLGTGSLLMKAVTDVWGGKADPSLFVMEVEDPRYFGRDDALGDPEARVRFYERLGARALPVPYFQPALSPDSHRVPNLLLMVFGGTGVFDGTGVPGGTGAVPGSRRVDGETVGLFLTEYLEGTEGPVRPDDTEAQRLLAACRAPDGLPLLLTRDLPAAPG
jgi:GNAT superfamily N-acetyltransferase